MEPIRANPTKQFISHICRSFRPRRITWVAAGLLIMALLSATLRTSQSRSGSRNNLEIEVRENPFVKKDIASLRDFHLHVNALFATNQPKNERDASADFDRAIAKAYKRVYPSLRNAPKRNQFELDQWVKRTNGGLNDTDRETLAELYSSADSVFEFGLGESTFIADHVGVRRYAGVDTDPFWIATTRGNVSSHFRFHLADVGQTEAWGYSEKPLKSVYNYQIAPLNSEAEPFDMYLVDGRWRLPCLLLSFLHASSRGAKQQDTIVVLHDCDRAPYHHGDHMFEIYDVPGSRLCVYKRKPQTTNAAIVRTWSKYMEKQT